MGSGQRGVHGVETRGRAETHKGPGMWHFIYLFFCSESWLPECVYLFLRIFYCVSQDRKQTPKGLGIPSLQRSMPSSHASAHDFEPGVPIWKNIKRAPTAVVWWSRSYSSWCNLRGTTRREVRSTSCGDLGTLSAVWLFLIPSCPLSLLQHPS